MEAIAHIYNDFREKFGVPRQSGLTEEMSSRIIFAPPYRDPSAFRGLENFSHIWLIWEFSQAQRTYWSATVRPPRLGGNERVGVFASRSPFRPNPIGLSCVRLGGIEYTKDKGPVITVLGADLMNGTPIYDIKPYLPYADSHPEARGGFTDELKWQELEVVFSEDVKDLSPEEEKQLRQILALDPRPHYQEDPDRVYGMTFGDRNIRFRVREGCLTVIGTESLPPKHN